MVTPSLDLLIMDTHNSKLIAIGDASSYPTGFNISSPTIEITPPNMPTVSLAFNAGGIQVYNSNTVGLTQDVDSCFLIPLPDGIWTIKYSIYPAYLYSVTVTVLRVEQFYSLFDEAFLKLDMMQCDLALKRTQRLLLDEIEYYIKGAMAAANKCALSTAIKLYQKGFKMLNNYINNNCKNQGNESCLC